MTAKKGSTDVDESQDDDVAAEDDALTEDEYDEEEPEGDGEEAEPFDGVDAIRRASALVGELTRKQPEGIVSMEETEAGGWKVGVEVVESHRIPDSADILAVYEIEIDDYLELVGFRRVRRYPRGRGEE